MDRHSMNTFDIYRLSTLSLLMLLTLVGNLAIVAIIIYRRQKRHKRIDVINLNLAIGDLMVCFVCIIFDILFIISRDLFLHSAVCKLVVYIRMVTLAFTTFVLCIISFNRFQVCSR